MGALGKVVMGALLTIWLVAEANATQQLPANRKITRISVYSTYAILQLSPAFDDLEDCNAGSLTIQNVVIDYGADSGRKNLYAAAIAAYSIGQNVGFGLQGCVAAGGGSPKAYRIDVSP